MDEDSSWKAKIHNDILYLIAITKDKFPESRERSLTLTKLEEALMWLERIKDES